MKENDAIHEKHILSVITGFQELGGVEAVRGNRLFRAIPR